MRIESFHIQGYKSLVDVKVGGLSDINVFYGLNGVGKSNIFEALALWQQLLRVSDTALLEQFEEEFGSPFTPLRGENRVQLKVVFTLEQQDLPEQNTGTYYLALAEIGSYFDKSDKIQVISEVEAEIVLMYPKPVLQRRIKNWAQVGTEILFDISQSALVTLFSYRLYLHIIKASRRFQIEQKGKGNGLGLVYDHNLKRSLFYAYLSSDLQQKARLAAIKRILAEPPFSLGELDVSLDPATDRIDIGFVRPDGRLPLENLGTGAQQLLLVLGQIFLNDYPIIAIEEPEMNLSPQYQQYLLVALRQLMQDPAVKLNQLFISTHSPYFEFEENFFDVSLDEQGRTQVACLPLEQRERYFPDTQVGPETGARLNSLNQVKLYDGVIKDLGLQRGDLVLFVKNDSGRWEIRPEDEIIQELDEIFDREKNQ